MNYNNLAPVIMGDDFHKKLDTPFGVILFSYHNPYPYPYPYPYPDCLWIRISKFRGSEVDVNTYLTASKLKNYGLMMAV